MLIAKTGGGALITKKRKKAFTLIELLAIIVILAIIAVITVPIILNIIENSKKGAATDSAYGYKDSVNKWYVSKLSEDHDFKISGEYTVTNGVLNGLGVNNVEIPVSGDKPTSGKLHYTNNVLDDGCLVIGDYKITFKSDGSVDKTVKGDCSDYEFSDGNSGSSSNEQSNGANRDARQTLITKSQNDETGNEPVAVSHAATVQTAATTDYRYMGATPNNYIYFNCSSYDENDQDSENCETWRIIGIVDGKIKLIKMESLGNFYWDFDQENYSQNEWSRATLKTFLNGDYYNSADDFYENEYEMGTINEGQNALTSATRSLISPSTWYLGGYTDEDNEFNVSAEEAYQTERGNTVYVCNGEENGNCFTRSIKVDNTSVGLMYLSDYGLASSACYNDSTKKLSNYIYIESCASSNWLFNIISSESVWTVSHLAGEGSPYYSEAMFIANGLLYSHSEDYWVEYSYSVHPTVYIDSNVDLVGDGTSESPYKIIKEN